jgi:thioesterase domain-containing protein/acyl carrier protein
VKRRGFRIDLGEIEACLMGHPAVRAAAVICQARERASELVAFLCWSDAQGTPDHGASTTTLRAHLRSALPAYMIPNRIVTLDALPLTANGKVDRALLPSLERPRALRHRALPRDPIEARLAEIWASILELDSIGIDEQFFDLGGDSLGAVRLMNAIRRAFGIDLSLATVFEAPSIRALAELVRGRGDACAWCSLVRIRSEGSEPPLICLPGAGGNVLYYNALAARLGPGQPVYGLQTPGLDGRREPHARVEDLARDHIETLRRLHIAGPYRLCGHSFGAHVAFEMCRQLLTDGEPVELLAVFDTPAPGATDLEWAAWMSGDADWLALITEIVAELLGKAIALDARVLRGLPEQERLEQVDARLRQAGWLSAGSGLEPLRALLRVYKANIHAHYRPECTLPLGITLFDAEETAWTPNDPTMGWQRHSTLPIRRYPCPGGHISILTEPQVQTLARHLSARLADTKVGD